MDRTIRHNLTEAYNAEARQRDASDIQPWKVEERAGFLVLLKKEHKQSLLEIGSGPGRDGKFFKDEGFDVTCIDLSTEMVNLCRLKGLKAQVMDAADLQFPVSSFDAVYALNSLLHLAKVELPRVLDNISSVLKSSGLFYFGVYGGYDFEGVRENDRCTPKRFFSFYTDNGLKQTVSKTFEIVHFETITLDNKEQLHFQSLILRKRNGKEPE
jgi:SAM-dependent methyltransferase